MLSAYNPVTWNTTEPMPATEAVTNDVPAAAGVVNVASAAPLDPLVVVATLSDPVVELQATATPGTGFPFRSVTRTLNSALAPATTAMESALTLTSADAGPAMPVAFSVAVLVPTMASSVFTFAVSLTVHTVVATPEESLTVTVSETVPLPPVGFQLTGMPNAGLPSSVTITLTRLELPAVTVRSAFTESTDTLNPLPLVPVVSGPEVEDASLEHAAATVSNAARGRIRVRIPGRHAGSVLP